MMNSAWKSSTLVLMLACTFLTGNLYAEGSPAQFKCTMTDQLDENGMPANSITSFSISGSANIFLICVSTDAKVGTVIKAEYFYDDSPNGQTIPGSTKSATASADASDDKPFVANLSPDMPAAPLKVLPGRYHVNLSVDKNPIDSISFDASN